MWFVNQKRIGDKVYTAYIDEKNPRKQYIKCDGELKAFRIKDVWNDNVKMVKLHPGKKVKEVKIKSHGK
jgi:hypothetical protein